MYYYEVAPVDRTYQGRETLTYHYDQLLTIGSVVVVKLRTKSINAFVTKAVEKPAFTTNPIAFPIDKLTLQPQHVAVFNWLTRYYPGPIGPSASLFVPAGLTTKQLTKDREPSAPATGNRTMPDASPAQASIISAITAACGQTHIIHGDTGTGKTNIYIDLALATIAKGRSVIILTPEISLTPQLTQRFQQNFSAVHIIHSGLTPAQRRTIWIDLKQNPGPHVVIGPRSALFAPLQDVGLIIVDEFHDAAYKQEQSPRYHANRVAATLAKQHRATLVLGSATPPVEDYFYAVSVDAQVHRITDLPTNQPRNRTIKIVNIRDENERTNLPLMSKTLLNLLDANLQNGQQSLVFLNKRGSARLILCQNCGWHADCPRCDIPYVYHADKHVLTCHTCDRTAPVPHQCPDCRSVDIHFKNPGTKAVVEALQKQFPKARIGRYDKDNKKHEQFDQHHAAIQRGEIDILVGTQILAKGHDLPKLSLVAVLLAEGALQFPDFSSTERSFQLLHQLSGRVGRGHQDGTVVIQTLDGEADYSSLAEYKNNAWEMFYQAELQQRKQHGFPPYRYLMSIEFARAKSATAEAAAQKYFQTIAGMPDLEIAGPLPAFFFQRAGKYHWQIIVKATKRSQLLALLPGLPGNCTYDIDPVSLL